MHRRRDETTHEHGARVFIQLVFDTRCVGRDLDHDVEIVRDILADGNVIDVHVFSLYGVVVCTRSKSRLT